MVAIDSHPNHTISWIDLAATDLEAALEFYCGLMGWTTFNDGQTPYHIFLNDNKAVAGAMQITEEMAGMPQMWSVYVQVADVEAMTSKAQSAGGQVIRPAFDVNDNGRVGVIADPGGAALCLIEGLEDSSIKTIDEPGAPCWFDNMSRDSGAVVGFMKELFGWNATPFEGFPYTMFDLDGTPIAGTMDIPTEMPGALGGHWLIDFSVTDADAAAGYVVENGGRVLDSPSDTEFGRACTLCDPWGAAFIAIDRSKASEENQPR